MRSRAGVLRVVCLSVNYKPEVLLVSMSTVCLCLLCIYDVSHVFVRTSNRSKGRRAVLLSKMPVTTEARVEGRARVARHQSGDPWAIEASQRGRRVQWRLCVRLLPVFDSVFHSFATSHLEARGTEPGERRIRKTRSRFLAVVLRPF